MIPGEILVATALAVGTTVPVAAVIEVAHPDVDMSRYEVRENCQVGGAIIERCLFDVTKGEVIGGKP